MKRLLIGLVVVSAVFSGIVFATSSAKADDSAPMTEAHIERIRRNCVEAQSLLSQLHASDALLRVNRGQRYEFISTKLMAPFNSRVAINRLNGVELVAVTADYERQLAAFRVDYQDYEESMSTTLQINCNNQPVAFYDSVALTRDKRKKVYDSTIQLKSSIQTYKTKFEEFANTMKESAE